MMTAQSSRASEAIVSYIYDYITFAVIFDTFSWTKMDRQKKLPLHIFEQISGMGFIQQAPCEARVPEMPYILVSFWRIVSATINPLNWMIIILFVFCFGCECHHVRNRNRRLGARVVHTKGSGWFTSCHSSARQNSFIPPLLCRNIEWSY